MGEDERRKSRERLPSYASPNMVTLPSVQHSQVCLFFHTHISTSHALHLLFAYWEPREELQKPCDTEVLHKNIDTRARLPRRGSDITVDTNEDGLDSGNAKSRLRSLCSVQLHGSHACIRRGAVVSRRLVGI